jgi:glycosyltransferase involved in cell wall biosynthesis
MPFPRVSILMLTFNRAEWISAAIESIVNQHRQDWELIVVHDGPNEAIAKVMAEWEKRDSRVRYFRRLQPGNIAEATNFGLAQAKGDYIAILDDDDRWATPDKLDKQITFLDESPAYVACGGGVIVTDSNARETLRYLKPEKDQDIKRVALIANPIAHSTAMYRRDAIEKCGGYDVSLAGFQDWDVWLKLGSIGKLYNFQEYFLYYTIWEGGGSFQQQKKNTRSALTIVSRHRSAYSGFPLAILMASMYHAYAHLPAGIKRTSFAYLSRLKKALFSKRPAHRAS